MGADTRHFKALLLKNFIYWKRRPAFALCQMLLPGLLMICICYFRSKITNINIQSQDLYLLKKPFYPVVFTNDSQPNFKQTSDNQRAFYDHFDYPLEFVPFDALEDVGGPLYFNPANCMLNSSFVDPKVAAPIIAVVGTINPVLQNVNSTLYLLQDFWQQKGVNDLYIQYFETQEDLDKYISSQSYLQPDPGVCFGFEVIQNNLEDYNVKLFFNDQILFGGENAAGTTPTNDPVWSISNSAPDIHAFDESTKDGYAFISNLIANAVLQISTQVPSASISTLIVPLPTQPQVIDPFFPIERDLFPTFLLLMFSLPVYNIVFLLVKEKETKSRETMRIMGLNELPYWLSWFTYYTIVNSVVSFIAWCFLIVNVVVTSGRGQLFIYIWMFGESVFGEVVFLQALFQRSKYAGLVSALFFIGISLANVPIQNNEAPKAIKLAASLIPQVANYQVAAVFAKLDESEVGMNRQTSHTEFDDYVFNQGISMFVAGFFLFLILGIYLDAVLPKEFGTRRHPCYFVFPSSYSGCCKKRTTQVEDELEQQRRCALEEFQVPGNEMELRNINPINYEPVAPETELQADAGQCLIIDGLEKTYDNGFKAVNGLNIKIFQNQIFAFLGQNGAGKTTTISILTGLIQSSGGKATAYNFDMFKEADRVRNFMGICPQYDVLFEFLTPIEHLNFFYELKGGNPELKAREINDLIKDVGLTQDKDKPAGTLSGGNKRKLSVAIALCGGSKLVLLDEPTAGMDLGARRALWDMLKNYRRDKIIILTTHYMDEADILGDRIGIMAKGRMMCLGTSLFLKQKFGTGYKLTMVKATKEKNNLVTPFLLEHLGNVELLSEVSSEIQFQVSQEAALNFKTFFEIFDQQLENLGVISYGVSITTLEDVFLKINKEFNIDIDKAVLPDDRGTVEVGQLIDSEINFVQGVGINSSVYELEENLIENKTVSGDLEIPQQLNEPQRLVGHSTSLVTITALLIKRLNIYKRDRTGLCCEVIVPFIMVLIGSLLTKLVFVDLTEPLTVDPILYPAPQRLLMNSQNINTTGYYNIPPETLFANLPSSGSVFQVTYQMDSQDAHKFYQDVYNQRLVGDTLPYRFGSYDLYYSDGFTQTYQFATYVNLTSPQASNFFPAFMYESIIRTATDNPQFSFQLTTQPFPSLYVLNQRRSSGNAFEYAQMVALGLALIPCVMVSFILKEREDSVKHMQVISGMSLTNYWLSNMIADLIKIYIPITIIILLSIIFDVNFPGVAALLCILPFALVPFTYTNSFLFKDDTSAQITTIFVNVLIGGVMAATVFFLQAIPETFWMGDLLRWIFCIIPNFCVINGMLWSSSGDLILKVRQSHSTYPQISPNLWAWQNLGGDAAILIAHFFIDTLLLILIEADLFSFLKSLSLRKVPPRDDILALDEDVLCEENRILNNCDDVIQVSDLRKAYTSFFGKPYLAVERISFGLDYGECFALLGVNGAGKSTTFKSLTADHELTNGKITVAGFNIQTQFQEAKQLIGYCPQKDAIFPLMSVEEHLIFYAKIKGIPEQLRDNIVEVAIEELNLSDHRKKPAGTLSGGNKRKLSVAMATLGNPPIILLDEPSAGMDPEARRFMWQVVSNISQRDKKSAVILTTHSMEEAEALSTKMGIMVRGGIFKCFGSSQHIKNKFGTGFEVEIKVRKPLQHELEQIARDCGIEMSLEERIDLDLAIFQSRKQQIEGFILEQIGEKGIGSALYFEAELGLTTVRVKNFVNYVYVVQMGLKVVSLLASLFPQVELIEQFSDFFKFRLPREDKTIGWLFGLIEDNKKLLNVSEYSVSQTSLEQIFQAFANQSINDRLNLVFKLDALKQLHLITSQ